MFALRKGGTRMNRHMEVSLTPQRHGGTPLLEYRTRSIGQRLWKRLFGHRRMVILLPAESIGAVTIIEQPVPSAPSGRAG